MEVRGERIKEIVVNVTRMGARLGVIVLVVGTVIGFFAEHGYWFDNAASFREVYVTFGVVGAVALFLTGGRKSAWAAVVVASVNLAYVLPWSAPVETQSECDDPTKVVVINAYIGNERLDMVVDYVRDERPKLLVVSELSPELGALLDAEFPYAWWMGHNGAYGIGIFSEYPLGTVEPVLDVVGPPQLDGIVHGPHGDFRLLAVHPSAPGHAHAARSRNLTIEALADRVRSSELPVVLAGDLNITMWSPHYRPLERAGLANARQGYGVEATFPARMPLFRVPIDHVMHTADISVCDFAVGPSVDSDHLPIVAQVQLPQSTRTTLAQSRLLR